MWCPWHAFFWHWLDGSNDEQYKAIPDITELYVHSLFLHKIKILWNLFPSPLNATLALENIMLHHNQAVVMDAL